MIFRAYVSPLLSLSVSLLDNNPKLICSLRVTGQEGLWRELHQGEEPTAPFCIIMCDRLNEYFFTVGPMLEPLAPLETDAQDEVDGHPLELRYR